MGLSIQELVGAPEQQTGGREGRAKKITDPIPGKMLEQIIKQLLSIEMIIR